MTRPQRPLARQLAVTVSFLLAIVGTAIGVGAFGGDPIAEAAGGLLAADSTHLAPASSAFMIWSVIYAGLGAYTLWQWWDRRDARGIAPGAILSLLLNAAWILTVQAGWVALSVVVIALLLVVIVLALMFAGRLYRVGVLMYGQPPKVTEIFKMRNAEGVAR